jgi:hypothetical protein
MLTPESWPSLLARSACGAVTLIALAAGDARAATLLVDQDRAQCPRAQFASIQAAVDNARPGDTVKICAGTYAERVTVDKPLLLDGDGTVVDPPEGAFTVAFRLAADDVELRGFTIRGASVGVDASDRFSGYRIDHNLIEDNALFGIDFGSAGGRESRVDHNQLSGNGLGVACELDDDSVWRPVPGGPERGLWNARDLVDARIDDNASSGNGDGVWITGPGRRQRVIIDDNRLVDDGAMALQNAGESAILDNTIAASAGNAMLVGGGSDGLRVAGNHISGFTNPDIAVGVYLTADTLGFDRFPIPNRNVVIAGNEIAGGTIAMDIKEHTLVDSLIIHNATGGQSSTGIFLRVGDTGNLISDNYTHDARGSGINLNTGTTGNTIRHNQSDHNGIGGITMVLGATGNAIDHNSMHGNGWRTDTALARGDARDINPLLNGVLQNAWTHNDCDTDVPAGLICGR